MKILVVTAPLDRSEAAIFRSLSKKGYSITLICDPELNVASELAQNGIDVRPFRFRSRLHPEALPFIRKIARESGAEIVHSLDKKAFSNSLAAIRDPAVKFIAYRGIIGNLSRWNPETRLTFMNTRVKSIICVCNAVRDYMLKLGIEESRLTTIYKGHDPAWYTPASRKRFTEFGIPENAPVLVCSASMRPRKGVSTLVQAFGLIRHKNAHLLLAGEITDRKIAPLIEKMAIGNRVHAPGYIPDAYALSGASDIFVMPSLRREGLPRSVIEAMIQGVPAVVTNVGGMPEIVDDGETGLIVPPGDKDRLASAIDALLDDGVRRSKMGRLAKQRIIEKFNISSTIEQTANLYKQI